MNNKYITVIKIKAFKEKYYNFMSNIIIIII